MPIKPEYAHLYPPKAEWEAIVAEVLERDGHRCRFCGVPNNQFVRRAKDNGALWERVPRTADGQCPAVDEDDVYERPVRIVLTTAHLDPSYNMDGIEFLVAACQRCHFIMDRALSAARRNGYNYALIPNERAIPASWQNNPCVSTIPDK